MSARCSLYVLYQSEAASTHGVWPFYSFTLQLPSANHNLSQRHCTLRTRSKLPKSKIQEHAPSVSKCPCSKDDKATLALLSRFHPLGNHAGESSPHNRTTSGNLTNPARLRLTKSVTLIPMQTPTCCSFTLARIIRSTSAELSPGTCCGDDQRERGFGP